MPAFEIDSPVDGFQYPHPNPPGLPPAPPIPINGNHDGDPYYNTKMWMLQGPGFAPATLQNPLEAGATAITNLGVASWSAGMVNGAAAGTTRHVRVWILKPGSLEFLYAKADFSFASTVTVAASPAPGSPPAGESAMARAASNGAPRRQSVQKKKTKKSTK
jgi:hypothetical protein